MRKVRPFVILRRGVDPWLWVGTVCVGGHAHFCGPQRGPRTKSSLQAGRSGRAGHILDIGISLTTLTDHFLRTYFETN